MENRHIFLENNYNESENEEKNLETMLPVNKNILKKEKYSPSASIVMAMSNREWQATV